MGIKETESSRKDVKMITLPCPNHPHHKAPEMVYVTHAYSYLNKKPTRYMEELKCPECGVRMRVRIQVISYKEEAQ